MKVSLSKLSVLSTHLTHEDARYRASLLSALLLGFIGVNIVASLLTLWVGQSPFSLPSTLLLIVLYGISRTRWAIVAAITLILVTAAAAYLPWFYDQYQAAPLATMTLWTAVNLVLCYLLLPSRWLYAAMLIHGISYSLLAPQYGAALVNSAAIAFLVIMLFIADLERHTDRAHVREKAQLLVDERARFQIAAELGADYAFALRMTPDDQHTLVWSQGSSSLESLIDQGFFNANERFVHPEDYIIVQSVLNHSKLGVTHRAEFRVRLVDGRERWLTLRTQMRLDPEQPDTRLLYGTVKDITERKSAEIARQQAEHRYRDLFQNAQIGMCSVDAQGHWLDVNPALLDMLGYSAEDGLLQAAPKFLNLLLGGQQAADALMQANARQGHYSAVELRLKRSDGTTFWALGQASPVMDTHGIIISYDIMLQDIDEHKNAEQQRVELAVADDRARVMQRFVGQASHDLLTPLSIMRTSLYFLERIGQRLTEVHKAVPEDARLEVFATVQSLDKRTHILAEQIDHIDKALKRLLKFSEMDPSRFHFEPVDINTLVRGVIATLESNEPRQQQARIQFDAHQPMPSAKVDPEEMRFALHQVLANALAYAPKDSSVQVVTSAFARDLTVTVTNYGPPIAEDDLPHIFEPFYRAFERDVEKGVIGLGLTFAKWIVQAHRGRIEVTSSAREGTCFTITLPTNPDMRSTLMNVQMQPRHAPTADFRITSEVEQVS